jgi:hypothetical protein
VQRWWHNKISPPTTAEVKKFALVAAAPVGSLDPVCAVGPFDSIDAVGTVAALDPGRPITAVAPAQAIVAIGLRLVSARAIAPRTAVAIACLGTQAAVLELRNHRRPVDDGLDLADRGTRLKRRDERLELILTLEAQSLELHLAVFDPGFESIAADRSQELHLGAGFVLDRGDQVGEGTA